MVFLLSLKAMAPPKCMSYISDSSFPSLLSETLPTGSRSTKLFLLLDNKNSTDALLSMAGWVSELTHTAVNPPFAAALRPLLISSLYSNCS